MSWYPFIVKQRIIHLYMYVIIIFTYVLKIFLMITVNKKGLLSSVHR